MVSEYVSWLLLKVSVDIWTEIGRLNVCVNLHTVAVNELRN